MSGYGYLTVGDVGDVNVDVDVDVDVDGCGPGFGRDFGFGSDCDFDFDFDFGLVPWGVWKPTRLMRWIDVAESPEFDRASLRSETEVVNASASQGTRLCASSSATYNVIAVKSPNPSSGSAADPHTPSNA